MTLDYHQCILIMQWIVWILSMNIIYKIIFLLCHCILIYIMNLLGLYFFQSLMGMIIIIHNMQQHGVLYLHMTW
ncbi:hypothetical protein CRM76_15330 [Edwardsiella tarda]|uniref:Uncharacterized protein n=1 Tax=Edwardsiella tarda TaxID=636 RepID=A0A2A7U457_EDWTA|nr:hypothetical protein CRM76_15330 [Edwardsiella tarda]